MDFNPRTREGCDRDDAGTMALEAEISIHAPVKGATEPALASVRQKAQFQSTHP